MSEKELIEIEEEKNEIEEDNTEVSNAKKEPKSAILKVKTDSDVHKLAGAITAVVKNHGYAELRGIGNGASGQACKAIIVASGHLKLSGIDLITVMSFFPTDLKDDDGNVISGTKFTCEDR